MQPYILGIAGVVLISAVVTIIAPGGKMGKFIKGAMKLFVILVLVAPFAEWLGSGQLTFGETTQTVVLDAGYLQTCADGLAEADERAIGQILEQKFSVKGDVEVKRRADVRFSYEKITVKIHDDGIFGQGEHKDITDRVQAYLEEKYGCPAEIS